MPNIFVRSGDIALTNTTGVLKNASISGYNWPSRAVDYATSANAYYLVFNASEVFSSGGPTDRYYAFPLRCLSTVLDMEKWQKYGDIIVKASVLWKNI